MPVTVTWTLTVPEVNTILIALGQRPFDEVAVLLLRLREQAEQQVKPPEA